MSKTIGIDLGTTNSVVAIMEGGDPTVLPNSEGGRTTPSVVAFTKNDRLVGQLARRQATVNSENTIYSVKRFMGRQIEEVVAEKELVPYRVVAGKNNRAEIEVAGTRYTPEQISAVILQKLKTDAEAYLGEKVTDAVITVPAYFNDAQRQATQNAGKIAGLNVLRIINEPTAAALAYGLERKKSENILVFDLGGGTFDVSILEVGDGVFEVKATNGDTHLGGDDYDRRVVDWIAEEFRREQGIDLKQDKQALQRLVEAAEKAKIELSQMQETQINLPFITADQNGPKHLDMKLSRAKFEQLTADLTQRCKVPFENALRDAKMMVRDLNEVVLVGGSTRMPVIQELVTSLTGKEPHRGVNPDEVVAIGAAIQGGVLSGEVKDVLLLDVTPLSLGIMTEGEINTRLIERNTTIPTSKGEVFSTAADNQSSVEIVVLQGERALAKDNRVLGKFVLDGIPPAPKGMPQIEVNFDIDANGVLRVSAKDRGTGREQKVTITGSTTMQKEEVERLVREAAANVEKDRTKLEEVALRNRCDALTYAADKQLREQAERLPRDLVNSITSLNEALRQAMAANDIDRMKSLEAQLSAELPKIGEAVYSQPPLESGATANNDDQEDVVDAEFREM